MYCPKCFNPTLKLASSGVVDVIINKKQMDAGRFLYNLTTQRQDQISRDFTKKLEEFFLWYSTFQNKEPITNIALTSSDFICEEGCRVGMNQKFSIVDILIAKNIIETKLNELGKKYKLEIKLESE